MDQLPNSLEAAVSAAGVCVVYNPEDWQLLSDANITPPPHPEAPPPFPH